jgi:uncharacterized damage-inducible protein DinB
MSASKIAEKLAQSYAATQSLLDQADLEMVVYENPVWRVRDVIWHLAVWDRQVTQSIEAFQSGGQYAIPEFDEINFNMDLIEESRQLTGEQVVEESQQARRQFIAVVERFSEDQLEADFLYPWGDESGNVTQLVDYMVEHDEEHRQEIIGAAN